MNDVKLSIQTEREGNKITKTCVEDVYKIVNRIQDAMNKAHNDSVDIIDTLYHEEYGEDTSVVFGTGISQPCLTDAFDEEIGNSLAFMKMKLNVNVKKHNFLCRIFNNYVRVLEKINDEIRNIDDKIKMDLSGIRKHNPSYLDDLEDRLGIIDETEEDDEV